MARSLDRATTLLTLNGRVVFEGTGQFGNQKLIVRNIPLPAGSVRPGRNILVIDNTGEGAASAVPWFGLSFVRLRSDTNRQ